MRSRYHLALRMPVIGRTQGMIPQNFDDPAIGDPTARTWYDHAFALPLQRA